MQIVRQSIAVAKPEGTKVAYYIFPEYEIHYNELPPNSVQPWHHHSVIEETIFVVAGEIEVRWLEHSTIVTEKVHHGDIVRVEDTPHTLANLSDNAATFLVVRLVLSGKSNDEIIRADKHLDIIPQGGNHQ